jgi:hypothetical protein
MSEAKSPRSLRQDERVRFAAYAILVVGLLAALSVFVSSADEPVTDPGNIARSKMYQHNLAVIGGHAAVNAARFNDWLGSLWHGRSLALIIALATLAIAGACFWIAHLMTIPPLPLHASGGEAADDALLEKRDQHGDRHDRDDERGGDDVPGKRELPLVERDADRQRAHPHGGVE